nr:venom protein [Lampona murina]
MKFDMLFSRFLFVTLVVYINNVAGHHLEKHIYEQMCGENETFREGLNNCLLETSRKSQLIFQLCGSAKLNDTLEDYNAIMDIMCEDEHYASKVALCIAHVSGIFHHFDDSDYHDHHHHEHDDNHDVDHEDYHHHHHHHHGIGHDIYDEECFQRLYEIFDITESDEDGKTNEE